MTENKLIDSNPCKEAWVDPMTKESLDEIEYLLHQSTRGFHLLFDRETIVTTLTTPTNDSEYFTFENLNKVQDVLTELIQQPTIRGKRSYLSSLDHETYELLVRTYFNIVENTLLESHPFHH